MKAMIVAAALAALPAAVCAQAPADLAAQGRALRLAGRSAEAVPVLERAAQAHPDDPDVWLDLGLARAQASDLSGADQALGRAGALAPDYLDVAIARARVSFFAGDIAEARSRLAPVLARAPQNAEALSLSRQLDAAAHAAAGPPPPPAWRLDAAYSRARLSKGLPDASDALVALGHRSGDGMSVSGLVEQVRQFGAADTFMEATVARRFGYLAVGGTPEADFRPRWSVRGGLVSDTWALGAGWTLQAAVDAGWARYPVGDVRSLHPSLTLAWGERLDVQAKWVNVLDERDQHRSGYALHADWRPVGPIQLSAGWAWAPESTDGTTVRVKATRFGAAADLSDNTTFKLGFAREVRPAYVREELTVGVTRRF